MMKRILLAGVAAALIVPAVVGLTVAEAAQASHHSNPQAVDLRINAACNAAARITRFASPNVAFEQCWIGARHAYHGNDAKCRAGIAQFSSEATRLSGQSRAEYIEIGNAYRTGCNIGKSTRASAL